MIPALIAGLGTAYSAASAQSAQRSAMRAARREAMALDQRRVQSQDFSRRSYIGAIKTVDDARTASLGAANSGREVGRQQALGQFSENQSDVAQGMISRGLYNTGAYDAARYRSVAGVSAALDAIDAEYARVNAEIEQGYASQKAGLQTGLAQQEQGFFAQDAALTGGRMDMSLSEQHGWTDVGAGIGALAESLSSYLGGGTDIWGNEIKQSANWDDLAPRERRRAMRDFLDGVGDEAPASTSGWGSMSKSQKNAVRSEASRQRSNLRFK